MKAYSTAGDCLPRKQVMISRNAKDRRTAAAYSLFAVFSAKHYVKFKEVDLLFHFNGPAHIISDLACLDAVDSIVHFLSHRTDLTVVDDHVGILVFQFAYR
mgnify:FL=1